MSQELPVGSNQDNVTLALPAAVGVIDGLGSATRCNLNRVIAFTLVVVGVQQKWRDAGIADVAVYQRLYGSAAKLVAATRAQSDCQHQKAL